MHALSRLFIRVAAATLALTSLSGCYFNSAGHLFDKASYEASVTTADLRPGDTIYVDASKYYVELPRYREGAPVVTQYPQEEQKQGEHEPQRTEEMTMVRITPQYATYLRGQDVLLSGAQVLSRCDDEDALKRRSSTYRVSRQPSVTTRYRFTYDSSAAIGWYTLGILDWLCIDLPITCVENAVMSCFGCWKLLDQANKVSKTDWGANFIGTPIKGSVGPGERTCRGCGGSGQSSYSVYIPCVLCGGSGRYEDGERGFENWAASQAGY